MPNSAAIFFQRLDLELRFGIVDALGPVRGRNIVVGDGERELGPAHAPVGERRPSKACGLVTSWTRWQSI